MAPQRPQDEARWAQWATMTPDSAQMAPTWRQHSPKMAQDSPKMGLRWAKMGPRGTEKGQDSRKTAKNKKVQISVVAFFAEGPRETLVFYTKKDVPTPRGTAPPEPRGGGRGRGKPFPEGERGVVKRLKK